MLLDWLSDFVHWLRAAVGADTEPIALETHLSNDGQCLLYLLADGQSETFPGLVQLWLVSHETAHFDLLIILVNLAQAKELRRTTAVATLPKDWHRAFEVKARLAMQQQRGIAASHLFLTGWVSKQPISARFVHSRLEYFRRVECSVVLALDLQGNTFAWAGRNDYAAKIVRTIAKRVLQTPPGQVLTWEELIRSLDADGLDGKVTWITWLHHYATKPKSTRIAEKHILQPPIVRSSFRTPSDES
ncbi:hypothetical protein [Stenomitos frigidus]|uniref:Uncharacterized protein n=1 Tax=Stenomitos frigidus ULC18 TaxID=2107698 RepID=A0A2T1EAY0_9CYAN|nr:hypothetical protein [Stenomitos frigidus]PSB29912.1 hypothetical protein C7B82_10185 [Stenomitos frigidus ULC18]